MTWKCSWEFPPERFNGSAVLRAPLTLHCASWERSRHLPLPVFRHVTSEITNKAAITATPSCCSPQSPKGGGWGEQCNCAAIWYTGTLQRLCSLARMEKLPIFPCVFVCVYVFCCEIEFKPPHCKQRFGGRVFKFFCEMRGEGDWQGVNSKWIKAEMLSAASEKQRNLLPLRVSPSAAALWPLQRASSGTDRGVAKFKLFNSSHAAVRRYIFCILWEDGAQMQRIAPFDIL